MESNHLTPGLGRNVLETLPFGDLVDQARLQNELAIDLLWNRVGTHAKYQLYCLGLDDELISELLDEVKTKWFVLDFGVPSKYPEACRWVKWRALDAFRKYRGLRKGWVELDTGNEPIDEKLRDALDGLLEEEKRASGLVKLLDVASPVQQEFIKIATQVIEDLESTDPRLPVKAIADRMNISVSTVKEHRDRLVKKVSGRQ